MYLYTLFFIIFIPTLLEVRYLEKIVITGGTPLKGEVNISGAKNAAIAILPATLLINGVCTIDNLPNVSDVKQYCNILKSLRR